MYVSYMRGLTVFLVLPKVILYCSRYFTSLFEYKEIRKVKTERKDIADAFQRYSIFKLLFIII